MARLAIGHGVSWPGASSLTLGWGMGGPNGREFIWGCVSGAPVAADRVSVERLLLGVKPSVAAAAQQGEIVEVGLALAGGMPWHAVMDVAFRGSGATLHAALVSQHESHVLGRRCMALEACQP